MANKENIIYVNEAMDYIHERITSLYESMIDMEYSETVTICNQLIEKLKEIKLDYTDETLL